MDTSTRVATAVETKAEKATASTEDTIYSKHIYTKWFEALHFNLNSFRLGGNITQRRFSISEAALLLMTAYIASRGLGVVRQSIFNAIFGTSPAASAYFAAFRLPDALFSLIAGGALTHAFIPVFLSYEKDHGQQNAWRLACLVFNVLLVTLTIFVLIAEFLAPAFVNNLLVPGFSPSEQALTTTLTRIMLVQPLILGLGTIATAILNSKRQFLLPAFSIAVYNVGLIGGLLFTLAFPKLGIYGPTYGVLAAALLQVIVQLPGLLKQGVRYSFYWNLRDSGLRQIMRLLGPSALAVGVASIGLIIETHFASYLTDRASVAALHNAYMLYDLPVALLVQAVAQATLPRLAALAAAGRFAHLRQTILKVVGAAVLLSIPCALGLYLFGKPLIELIFQHGAFNRHSSSLTDLALLGYLVALPGVIASELFAKGFYALKDAWTPLFTNVLALATRSVLIIYLLKALAGKHVLIAIPLALAGAVTTEGLILGLILIVRLRMKVRREKSMQPLHSEPLPANEAIEEAELEQALQSISELEVSEESAP